MALKMPLVPCVANAKISKSPKSHVKSQFDCLELRNATVTLMTPLTSCDASASGMI